MPRNTAQVFSGTSKDRFFPPLPYSCAHANVCCGVLHVDMTCSSVAISAPRLFSGTFWTSFAAGGLRPRSFSARNHGLMDTGFAFAEKLAMSTEGQLQLTPETRTGARLGAAPPASLKAVLLVSRMCPSRGSRVFLTALTQPPVFGRYRHRQRLLPVGVLSSSCSSGAARTSTTQFLLSVMALTAARFC